MYEQIRPSNVASYFLASSASVNSGGEYARGNGEVLAQCMIVHNKQYYIVRRGHSEC